ncbi:hypothetical protein [Amycolatopsis sp. NPDC051903]|uniref:hypothetical protein n=1 Tax=Amycolatopsis sp. NPDC051903 TaxID=3363936 RepID=UPI0037B9141F
MSELLDLVLAAHGGADRWRQVRQLCADVSVGGSSWPSDGVLAATVATVDTREQRVSWEPFGEPGRRGRFTPERVEILAADGAVVGGRDDPRASFAGFTPETPWDRLHKLYFSG